MSTCSVGTCFTDRATRYGKQLATHMSRRHGGGWDSVSNTGTIELIKGRAVVSCGADSGRDTLVVTLDADDAESARFLEDVIERHLVKFGAKDGLTMTWTPGGNRS